jgi:pSer/pThr/pTyr-binding forkhead associated (FHA) protein
MSKFSLAAFQEACQAAGPLSLTIAGDGPERGRRLQLEQPFAVLGSHAQAHARWQDPEVSPRHAFVQIIDGKVFAVDLESRTGTFWGENSRCFGWLGREGSLRLGSGRFWIEHPAAIADPGWNPLSPQTLDEENPARLHFEIVSGKENPTVWTANRVLFMIGKSDLCKVRLHSPEISRFHASVVCTSQGAWIVDLLSRTGVFLNGKRVAAARLDPGDQIRLGAFLIRVHAHYPSARRSESAASSLYPSVEIPNALQPVGPGPAVLVGNIPEDAAVQTNGYQTNGFHANACHPLMESLLLPLINQFSTMQQQMFEQFQQNLLMLFQMFQVTQKEQLALVHEELRNVQEITIQLSSLQAELLAREVQARASAAAPAAVPSGPAERPAYRDVPGAPVPGAPAPGAPAPGAPAPGAGGKPTPPRSEPTPATKSDGLNGKTQPGAAHVPSCDTPRRFPGQREFPSDDVHARLCERISLLQQERQTRWQRIMTFVLRK